MALTLVPSTLAKEGHRFTFRGANAGEECQGCPVQRLCFGLQPGHTYQVDALRKVEHPCGLHDEGKVRVVEVSPAPFETTVEARLLRGTATSWTPIACGMPQCANWHLCHPVGPTPGARYSIEATGPAVACPADHVLRRVTLKRL